MILEQEIGPVGFVANRNETAFRGDSTAATVVQAAHGKYREASSRGNTYIASSQTGQTTAAGLSATPATIALFNPKNSGVNLSVLYAGCVFTVAFAAAAVVWLGLSDNPAAADVTGTAATVRNTLIANKTGSGKAFTAPTLPAVPVAGPILGLGVTGAITTAPSEPEMGRDFDGSIEIPPGCAVSFQTSTASGASAFFGEIIWEEIPIQ